MAHSETTTSSDRFANFHITDCTYKTIENHAIKCTVLTPKTAVSGKRPVIVRWHGGFLFTGTRMFPDWWPSWYAGPDPVHRHNLTSISANNTPSNRILDYAHHHSAILIAPDYRLLPEASGLDILSDISSFWSWIGTSLPSVLSSLKPDSVTADLSQVLVTGDSAGGWCAVHSALSQTPSTMKGINIRALAVAYGMLDMRRPWWSEAGEKHPFGAPTVPAVVLNNHIKAVEKGEAPKICSVGQPPERLPLCMVAVQQGLYPKLMGTETELYPMEVLDKVEKDSPPAMWLYHGKEVCHDERLKNEDTLS